MKHIIIALALLAFVPSFATGQSKKAKKQNTSQVANDSTYIDNLKKKAEAGDSNAQNTLGVCYYTGDKVAKDYETALKWWSVAAKASHAEAIANMGLCYQLGHGTKLDSLMAVKLYKQSVKRGNKSFITERENRLKDNVNLFDACFLADVFEEGIVVTKDLNKAVKYYVMAGNAGLKTSFMKAADIYEKDKNYPQAFKLYAKAAGAEVEAAYKCGEYLYKGIGVAVNKAEAAKYLKVAAKNQIPNAQIMLGDLYFKGEGVEKSVEKALGLYKSAALNDNPVAMWNVGLVYIEGVEDVKKDLQRGLYWMAKASEKGMKQNFNKKLNEEKGGKNDGWKGTDFYEYVKGMALLYGNDKNIDEAFDIFSKLEKKGLAIGTTLKALCYTDKDWKKANEKKTVKLLVKASGENEPSACYELALRYEKGNEVAADKDKALALIQKATDKDYAQAICHLGILYNEGKMVEKNITWAIEYFLRAMKEGYLSTQAANILSQCYSQGLGGLKKDQKMAQTVLAKAVKSDPVLSLVKDLKIE